VVSSVSQIRINAGLTARGSGPRSASGAADEDGEAPRAIFSTFEYASGYFRLDRRWDGNVTLPKESNGATLSSRAGGTEIPRGANAAPTR
jgi:hypothetical protein